MTRGLKYSLILHITVVAIFSFDFFNIAHKNLPPSEVPLIIDLTNLKITEKTNLPPKVEPKTTPKTEPKKVEPKPKTEPEKTKPKTLPPTKPTPPPPPKKSEPKTEPKTVKLEPLEEPKKEVLKKSEPPKEAEKKAEQKPPTKPPQPVLTPKKQTEPKENLALKSLLASISKIEDAIKERPKEEPDEDNYNNEGIVGGTGGFLNRDLTISDKDALAARIRQCWNFDAGAKGIENMVIEIRAYLNQDGSVRSVDILDTNRYNNDSFFRSIAESARRAVFICSPFTMLPERYPDKFENWKTLFLRFNPMDGGVS